MISVWASCGQFVEIICNYCMFQPHDHQLKRKICLQLNLVDDPDPKIQYNKKLGLPFMSSFSPLGPMSSRE
jgi:hypothetical protein